MADQVGVDPAVALRPLPKIQKVGSIAEENGSHINGSDAVTASPCMGGLSVLSSLTPLYVKRLCESATLPVRGSLLAAGYDLASAFGSVVPARGKELVKTGLSISIPEGTYGRIAPRSGLALKHSIDVGAGVIDADYRGPVDVILFNHSDQDFVINAGDRVAQLILEKIVTPEVVEVEDLAATQRGDGGFGSTGVSSVLTDCC
eukprot:c43025_g1_i1 orf=305-913(-)